MLAAILAAVAAALAWFLIEAVSDLLGCAWQTAREQRRAGRAANLGVTMFAMTYAPLLVGHLTGAWVAAALGGAAGAWVGSYCGVKWCAART